MMTEHQTTLGMLAGIDHLADRINEELMKDFRDLRTFDEKCDRAALIRELQLSLRKLVLDRCVQIPSDLRNREVEANIKRQRQMVGALEGLLAVRDFNPLTSADGLPTTLRAIGWTLAPGEWGAAPYYLVEESAEPFLAQFCRNGTVETVPELWYEGVTPGDMPEEYREAMRADGLLPPFNEEFCSRSDWVAFFLEAGTGATDPAKWQRVFGTVPRLSR